MRCLSKVISARSGNLAGSSYRHLLQMNSAECQRFWNVDWTSIFCPGWVPCGGAMIGGTYEDVGQSHGQVGGLRTEKDPISPSTRGPNKRIAGSGVTSGDTWAGYGNTPLTSFI